jgi:hypothetical protein
VEALRYDPSFTDRTNGAGPAAGVGLTGRAEVMTTSVVSLI